LTSVNPLERESPMRALVTGVSGFVGGHLAEHLVAQGDLVVGLSASGRWPGELADLGRTVRIEPFDLVERDEAELAELVRRKQPEVIYHLAAQSNPQASLSDPRGTWTLNLVGSLNLLEAVKSSGQKPRVILVGSGVSYGNPAPEFIPVREDCPLRPTNPYAASKAAVDLLGTQHHLANGTDVLMVRPFNHAGPRQSSRYVLAALALQVAEVESGRRDCLEVGNLDVVRDFTDVRDVVRAYRLLVQGGAPGEVYNLGSGQGTKIVDALEHLRSLATTAIPVRVDAGRVRAVDLPLLVADPTKLRDAVGWKPSLTIEQTLADMLDFCRKTLA
jgi:GDP-4-dehydro-6-deoxy-D-mannose reductase